MTLRLSKNTILGFILLTHEMQNVECKIAKCAYFLRSNEPGEPNGVADFAGLKSQIVCGDSPLN